jgi:FAD/FMN-containing dehydrogenase
MRLKLRSKKLRWWHIVLGLLFCILIAFVSVIVITHGNPIPAKLEREKANTAKNIVNDVTEINPVQTLGIIVPHETSEIQEAVRTHDHVSIGGGRNSMGGQTASTRAVQIDMREFNKILSFSTTTKEITVQSGIRWRDIQDYIDPYDLSVKIMQTYSNFTVGGSLSVNVHGRYVGLGPIILSVKNFRIVLADGSLIEASPTQNPDIFYSAIGGMGGIGVITDVTLFLADNVNVERERVKVTTDEYVDYFKEHVRSNPDVIFHNGDMYPLDFDSVSAVSWVKTDKAATTDSRLIPRFKDYWKERAAWVIMSEWPGGLWLREHIIDPLLYTGENPVHTRNYEASYDIAELEPKDRDGSTYVLQEYFVPIDRFSEWVPKMKKVFVDNNVNVINVSIRHALPDPGAKLAWAKTESFAFVVYYKQGTDEASKEKVQKWTREMIDQVISVGGAYYLPYQLLATDDQLHKAYPHIDEYFAIKKRYDPTDKFTNSLWDKYYHPNGEVLDDVRPLANTYLSIPEWYIVYNAKEYATVLREGEPSSFPFIESNRRYWDEYNAILSHSDNSSVSKDYITVLQVIGYSFSVENAIKGVYEHSIGRISEFISGGKRVPEEDVAARMAEDYASFIYDYPWYDFPFWSYLHDVWTVHAGNDCCTLGQSMRRAERKLYISLEIGIKAAYSHVIAFATHQKFGVQDDIVCANISLGKEKDKLCAPHYQPFTKKLIEAMEKEKDNPNFTIKDIAGNDRIVVTYIESQTDRSSYENIEELFRYPEISSVEGKKINYKDRVIDMVPVTYLPILYQTLKSRGIAIDHLYDY